MPDAVVRAADQIELVDMSPEALRRRMAHGNIYPAERVDAALANYFRPGNLGALRELALLWVADRVEESLQGYLDDHGIIDAWETRERVVVAMGGAPDGERLIRRAARMAGRMQGELLGVHVLAADGLADPVSGALDHQRELLSQLGGAYHEVVGDDVASALASFAVAERATQVVIGASRRSRLKELLRGSPVTSVLRRLGSVDVHVIASEADESTGGSRALPAVRSVSALPLRRKVAGWLLAVTLLPLLTVVLTAYRDELLLSTILVLYLAAVVLIAAVGGLVVGLAAAVAAFLLENWYFTPPIHQWTVAEGENLVALTAFVAVSALVSFLVGRALRRSREALRARAEAEALARTTGSLIGEADPLPTLVEQLRSSFGLNGVSVVERSETGWVTLAASGVAAAAEPGPGMAIDLDDTGQRRLILTGGQLGSVDQQVLRAFADQLTLALESKELREDALEAEALVETDALRRSLLQAVSHDLRTPLASIKAAVTSLLQRDVAWSPADRDDLLSTIDTATDQLDRVVANLLDMSRLQSGALSLRCAPVALEDVVAAALSGLPLDGHRTELDVPETVPLVEADPALLERAVANVVSNALAWSPRESAVRIEASPVQDRVCLRVIDRGPGIPPAQRAHIFEPFSRVGDRSQRRRGRLGSGRRARLRHGDARRHQRRRHTGWRPDGDHHAGQVRRSGVSGRVLVVDDEPQIRRALSVNLKARGYDVDQAASGEEALHLAAARHPDVVLLDLGLPGIDGLDVIRGLRGWTSVPIVVLSVREAEADKVAALDLGADDYLTKPFGMDELLARLRAALRRHQPAAEEPVVETPDFRVDLAARRVTVADVEVHLTPTEWGILDVLLRHPGRLVSQRQLLQQVWGPTYERETNYLRVYLAQLRRKLEPDPARPRYLITEPGMGYRFQPAAKYK